MAKSKVKIKTNLGLKEYRHKLRYNSAIAWRQYIREAIQEHIMSGKSPVDNRVKNAKWKDYSKDYAKLKGKKRPVDMLVTGQMLESLFVVLKMRGSTLLTIGFRSKIAKYHDKLGAGKSKVIRRLLPNDKEAFTPKIMNDLRRILKLAIKKTKK